MMPVVFFFTLPLLFGVPGIWLAVAAGDVAVTLAVVILLSIDRRRKTLKREM